MSDPREIGQRIAVTTATGFLVLELWGSECTECGNATPGDTHCDECGEPGDRLWHEVAS